MIMPLMKASYNKLRLIPGYKLYKPELRTDYIEYCMIKNLKMALFQKNITAMILRHY